MFAQVIRDIVEHMCDSRLPDHSIVCGEALATMRSLPTATFDALITDPPYCSGGTTSADRTTRSARDKYVSSDSKSGLAMPDFPDQRDQRSFTIWCSIWLTEALRLVRPGGQACIFTDWRQLPALSDALQVAGWRWRGIVIWNKPGARPQPGFKNESEYVLWASHGQIATEHKPPILPGTYSYSTPRGNNRHHITAKPVELMQQLVRVVPAGSRILDPFAGSGTTGVAAILEGHQFLGIEGVPKYADIATQRLAEARQ